MLSEITRDIIANVLNVPCDKAKDEINPESRFYEDLGADSLDLSNILSAVEETFDIDFLPKAYQGFKTVGQLTDYIKSAVEYSV